MTIQFQLLMLAMDDARSLRVAGDIDGAADLRGSAERDFIADKLDQIERERNAQLELAL